MTQQRSNTWKNIGITTVVVLSLFLVYFVFSNNNTYKKEIKSLKTTINSLEHSLEGKVDRDSILSLLSEQEALNLLIEKSNIKLDSLSKKKEYESNIDYYTISLDSNLVILTRNLCK